MFGGQIGTSRFLAVMVVAVLMMAGRASSTEGDVAVWLVNSQTIESSTTINGFLNDRLGASGRYGVIGSQKAKSVARATRYDQSRVFDAESTTSFARALGARYVLWVKTVDRSVSSEKMLSIPHLFSHRRPRMHIFMDCRIWDAATMQLVASRRVKLSKGGEGSIQVTEDERNDPIYNNDAVEFYRGFQQLEWEAAGRIAAWFFQETAEDTRNPAGHVDALTGPFRFSTERERPLK